MENNQFYKITIENKDGTIMHQIQSDCIIAAINNPEEERTEGISIIECTGANILYTVKTLNELKSQLFEKFPALREAELLDLLNAVLGDKDEAEGDK